MPLGLNACSSEMEQRLRRLFEAARKRSGVGFAQQALTIQPLSLYSLQLMRESKCMCNKRNPRNCVTHSVFQLESSGKLLIYNRNTSSGTSEGAWQ